MTGKKMNLRTKVILIAATFILMTNLVLGFGLTYRMQTATKTQINERMLDIVNSAAAMLDGDVLARLRAEDKGTPEYEQVYDTLAKFRDNINLDYIYYVRETGDKTFTFGIDTDPVAPGEFGSPVVYTDALYKASQGVPAVDEDPYEDQWGRFYSAFSPVFDSNGEVTGIVTADFNAEWYEGHINENQRMILTGCLLFLLISIAITFILTGQYNREMRRIKADLTDLAEDLDSLTEEFADTDNDAKAGDAVTNQAPPSDDIQSLGKRISELRDDFRSYISHTTTQANNMITAMATDYRAVYYIDLDENDGVCYRCDPEDQDQTPEGVHFPYQERFRYYAENYVADSYRDGFLSFIDPDHIREALSEQPSISYRYLAQKDGREYYEMIRMAGVHRPEDRDDYTVHTIGLGLEVIDEEMRQTLARNEALAEALVQAEEASNAKSSFLSSMSHEIRTPMNAIIGLNKLALRDDTMLPQTREYLEKTGKSADHLLGIINEILDMSRIEAGRIVLSRERFSLGSMIEQINTMVTSQCNDKGLAYECHILNQVDGCYVGDELKLKQVLINMLSNAIKFTEAPGKVTFTIEKTAEFDDQSTMRIRVKDTGIGMDQEYIPRIFDPFSQEDSSRKNKYGSTGLGMAIAKNFVELMNGTISVESEKGKGTEFTVVVTLKNSRHEDAAGPGSGETGGAPDSGADAPGGGPVSGSDAPDGVPDKGAGAAASDGVPDSDPDAPDSVPPQEADDEVPPAETEDHATLAGRRVLLVEDMELNAEIVMDLLEIEEIEADHAENGKIAVEMFSENAPGTYCAILMDIRMPVMDGLEAAAAIRAIDRPDAGKIPIIALTANAFDEDVQRSLQAGMNAHLTKPVDSDLLIKTMEELVREAEA